MNKKKYITLFLLLIFFTSLAGAEITLSLDPARPSAGRSVMLNISASARNIQVRKKPSVKGIRWGGTGGSRTMMQMSFSSGSGGQQTMTSSTGIELTVEKEGRYTIPPFEVLLDGKKAMTPEFSFVADPKPDYSGSLTGNEKQKKIFAILQVPGFGKRESCFVGEELPLDFLVFFSHSIKYEIQPVSQPLFRAETGSADIRFRDYRKKNPRALNYESQDTSVQDIRGQKYTVCKFTTRFRPISAGELKLYAEWNVQYSDGGGFFARYSDPFTIHSTLSSIQVEPLPQKPDDLPPFCGLVGNDWKITGTLHPGKNMIGDPVTLKIHVTGTGSTEAFAMPDLTESGFRIYPAEITRDAHGVTVSCTMIPVRDGKLTVQTGFSTFDPGKKEYIPFRFEQKLNIKKTDNLLPSSGGKAYVDASAVPVDTSAGPAAPAVRPKDILYLHKDISEKIAYPLWKNILTSGGILLAVGVLSLIILLYSAIHANACRNDPSLARRRTAGKQKGKLIRMIRNTPPDELAGMSSALSDYLNGVLDLPPGSGLDQAADRFKEGKTAFFGQALKDFAQTAWMPGAAAPVSEKTKKDLIRGLSRFTIFFLSISAILLFPGTVSGAEKPVLTQDEALSAYDSGNFKAALEFYGRELKKTSGVSVSPSVLYNMGNCFYQMGELPRALVCYERAHRLAPRDSDILENLNLTRRKLLLNETDRIEKPSDLVFWLRDVLRLDEWILIGILGISLCLISLGLFVRFRKRWGILLFAGAILFLAAAAAAAAQQAVLFSRSTAIIVKRNTPVYTLPSERPGSVQHHLKEGQEVHVEETRLGWARIRTGGEEGWIRESDMLPLWRDDMSDLL